MRDALQQHISYSSTLQYIDQLLKRLDECQLTYDR